VSTSPSPRERPDLPCADLAREHGGWRSQFALPLAPAPGERVLELGFGHGRTIAWLAERTGPDGLVAGADPSDTMLRQASARNRDAIAARRCGSRRGTRSGFPSPTAASTGCSRTLRRNVGRDVVGISARR
jgi:SAM-dependent methyltransferase